MGLSARAALSVVMALGVLTLERAARPDEPDPAFALFQEGRDLSARGDYASACAKFAASFALRPKLGTELNLGDCSERLGRTATARAHFLEAAAKARSEGDAARAEYAAGRADALAGRVPHVLLRGFPRATDAHLRVDGAATPAATGENDLPLDPGEHELAVDIAGRETWSRKVHVDDAAAPLVVEVPPADEHPVATQEAPPAPTTPIASHSGDRPSGSAGWQRFAALGAAGVAVAALGVGAYYGLHANSQWNDAKSNCSALPLCNATGVRETSDAMQSALAADIAFGIGLGALAAGAVLWWTAPAASPSASRPLAATPIVGSHSAGLVLQGGFP